jgi:hypothetical protein
MIWMSPLGLDDHSKRTPRVRVCGKVRGQGLTCTLKWEPDRLGRSRRLRGALPARAAQGRPPRRRGRSRWKSHGYPVSQGTLDHCRKLCMT